MATPDNKIDPTADYRKYAKGPNFGLIVGLACAALLIVLFGAWLILRGDPRLVPKAHGPLNREQRQAPSPVNPGSTSSPQ